MAAAIPDNFRDLFEKPVVVSVATVMPNGQPQVTPVWIDLEGGNLRVNTARGRQKDKNMTPGAKVTVLAIDPQNPYRWIEVRGTVVDETEVGAVDHINLLSAKYRGNPDYYSAYPERRTQETRVIYRIEPTRVNTSR